MIDKDKLLTLAAIDILRLEFRVSELESELEREEFVKRKMMYKI